jgi:hypothetical protein
MRFSLSFIALLTMTSFAAAETIDPLSCEDRALMEKYDLPLGPFENLPCTPSDTGDVFEGMTPDLLENTIEDMKKGLPLNKRIELDPQEWA